MFLISLLRNPVVSIIVSYDDASTHANDTKILLNEWMNEWFIFQNILHQKFVFLSQNFSAFQKCNNFSTIASTTFKKIE